MQARPINRGEPVAYIRRSVARHADPGDISREFQTGEVLRLAGTDADRLRIIDGDWGRSAATDKTNARLGFLAMLAEIERGEVSTVYAFSADRLARSVEWSARLLNACRRAGTMIVTGEGRFGPDDDAATDLFNFRAVVNESTLRQMEKKSQAAVERRRERNLEAGRDETEGMGRPRYEAENDAVIAAFEKAGSLHGAAKILNAAGVLTWGQRNFKDPDHKAAARWTHGTVKDVIDRSAPGLRTPGAGRKGASARGAHALAGLLRCPSCDGILSPSTGTRRGRDGAVRKIEMRYYCYRAWNDSSHARPYGVSEATILPWIKAEAGRLRAPGRDYHEIVATAVAEAERLAAKRTRWLEMRADGQIDRDELRQRLEAIDKAEEKIQTTLRAIHLPVAAVPWTAPPAAINAVLRGMWSEVKMELVEEAGRLALRPVEASWTLDAEWIRPR